MKTIKFLTFVLVTNLIIAIANDWSQLNKWLVIINALAVLLLIAMAIFSRKEV